MKLLAFRDRKDDPNKAMGRHHALDLFRVMAMLTRSEYEAAKAMHERYADDPMIAHARQVIRDHFATETSLGSIRLREHPLFRPRMNVARFISELNEVFQVS